jgi:hypothetical protein
MEGKDLLEICDAILNAFQRDGLLASFLMHRLAGAIQSRFSDANLKIPSAIAEKVTLVNAVASQKGHPIVGKLTIWE